MLHSCARVAQRFPAGNRFEGDALSPRQITRRGPQMPQVENDRIVETATEARAGATGHNVRYVLFAGTAAVIVLFGIVYLSFFAS
jgi:hypothetical protein